MKRPESRYVSQWEMGLVCSCCVSCNGTRQACTTNNPVKRTGKSNEREREICERGRGRLKRLMSSLVSLKYTRDLCYHYGAMFNYLWM